MSSKNLTLKRVLVSGGGLAGPAIATLLARDGVDVTLSDGTERTVDLVIGADGPHSATRRLAFGPEDNFIHSIGGYMA